MPQLWIYCHAIGKRRLMVYLESSGQRIERNSGFKTAEGRKLRGGGNSRMKVLRTRLLLRPKSVEMNHLTVITVIENLGALFESSDLSKRRQTRANLISRNFLGNAASHQVIRFWFWFHQSDWTIHRKTATFTDFSFSLYKSVNLKSAK